MPKVTFINLDYGEVFEARHQDEMLDPDDWHYIADELVVQGYKVTIATNTRGEGRSVTITDKRDGTKNKGVIVNAWGSSIGKAFSRAEFFVREAERLEISWAELNKDYQRHQVDDLAKFKEFIEWQRKNGKL